MTPSQLAQREIVRLENARKADIRAEKRDVLDVLEKYGPLTAMELCDLCRLGKTTYAYGLLSQMRKEHKVARRENGEWVLV